MDKLRKIKIETPNGVRYLTFRPVVKLPEETKLACDSVCPIGGKICRKLRDPRNPEDKDSCFMDFCSNLGEGDDKENGILMQYRPENGTVEENLYDIDNVYDVLIKNNGYVKITEVIDSVCKDTCPMWCADHSKCNVSNNMCLLQDLLKNNRYEEGIEEKLLAETQEENKQ